MSVRRHDNNSQQLNNSVLCDGASVYVLTGAALPVSDVLWIADRRDVPVRLSEERVLKPNAVACLATDFSFGNGYDLFTVDHACTY